MQKWEYHVISEFPNAELSQELNRLGGEGWELVAVISNPFNGALVLCYLKRLAP